MKNKFDQLQKIIIKLMRKFKVPGVAIIILQDNKTVYEKGFGARNLEENLPMTPNSLIGIGSISKSFTTLLIASCLLNKGLYKNKQVVNSESIDIVWTPQIKSPYGYGKDPKYCFGWMRDEDFLGQTLVHHSGGLGVSISFFGLIPELNLAVCVAENDDSGISSVIGICALTIMAGKNPEEINDRLRILEIYDKIAGKYKSSLGLYNLEISFKSWSIHIKVESDDGTFNFPLIIEDYDELIFNIFSTIPSTLQKVKFYTDTNTGKVEYVTYDRYLYHKT